MSDHEGDAKFTREDTRRAAELERDLKATPEAELEALNRLARELPWRTDPEGAEAFKQGAAAIGFDISSPSAIERRRAELEAILGLSARRDDSGNVN